MPRNVLIHLCKTSLLEAQFKSISRSLYYEKLQADSWAS